MDLTTAALMLVAGLLHACWHGIVKTRGGLSTLAGMGLVSTALSSPLLFFVQIPPWQVWPILALSVVLHALYKASLALAYEQGDLSRAYPLARGLVPIFSAVLSYVVLSQIPNVGQIAGILTVSAGVLMLTFERIAGLINPRLALGAFGAGSMVAGYSVVDAYGTRAGAGWASFTVWLIILDSLVFLSVARAIRGPELWCEFGDSKWRTAAAGLLGVTSFAIFIWALSRHPVAVVVAFRECSILFATMIGLLIFKEPVSAWRLTAVASIAAGLFLVAAWR